MKSDDVTPKNSNVTTLSPRIFPSMPNVVFDGKSLVISLFLFALLVGNLQATDAAAGADRLHRDGVKNQPERRHQQRQHQHPRHRQTSDPLEVECGTYEVCNLATHFCDDVVRSCIRCDDDCHPGRINGDSFAVADCKEKCKVYYAFKDKKDDDVDDEKKSLQTKKRSSSKDGSQKGNLGPSSFSSSSSSSSSSFSSDRALYKLSARHFNLGLVRTVVVLTPSFDQLEKLILVETTLVAVAIFLLLVVIIILAILVQRRSVEARIYNYDRRLDSSAKKAMTESGRREGA